MQIASLASLVLQEAFPGGESAGFIILAVVAAFYAFFAICLQKIAEKTNTDNAWWAWVPILQAFLMLKIADRPMWWIVLLFIPLVNFVITLVVLVDICKAREKSPAWVVAFLFPGVNLLALGYLGFSE